MVVHLFLLLTLGLFVAFCVGLLRMASQSATPPRVTRQPLSPRLPVQSSRPGRPVQRQVGRPGAISVAPQACALWEQRGWRQHGKTLRGAFRTHWGSCSGEITLDLRGRARDYFIISPPAALLDGSHGPCFRARGGGRYWVHFNSHTGDVDSGIVAVERLLSEALNA